MTQPPAYSSLLAEQAPKPPAKLKSALPLIAFILGIAAIIIAIVPIIWGLAIPLGLAAAVVGAIALLKRAHPDWQGIAGLALGSLAALIAVGLMINAAVQLSKLEEALDAPMVEATAAPAPAGTAAPVESPAPAAPVEEAAPEPAPAAPVEEAAPEPAPAAPVEKAAPEPAAVPVEFTSALRKAGDYSQNLHMSKAGLYDQLTSEYGEQFSPEAAQYAVDNVKADWNANALAKAKDYQSQMAMSPEAIRDQLKSEYGEQFTAEEADFAILHLND